MIESKKNGSEPSNKEIYETISTSWKVNGGLVTEEAQYVKMKFYLMKELICFVVPRIMEGGSEPLSLNKRNCLKICTKNNGLP